MFEEGLVGKTGGYKCYLAETENPVDLANGISTVHHALCSAYHTILASVIIIIILLACFVQVQFEICISGPTHACTCILLTAAFV